MPPLNENDCDACRILDVTTCPLYDRAVLMGLRGLRHCEMKPVIDKVYEAGQSAHHYNNRKAG